jgi:stress-induced morphogen
MKVKIQQVLEENFPNAQVAVLDPMQDDTHLEAVVISEEFEGLGLLAQHRMVMNSLQEHFSADLHALALKTYSPQSWKKHTEGAS